MKKNVITIKITGTNLPPEEFAIHCEKLFHLRSARKIGDIETINHTVLGRLKENPLSIQFEICPGTRQVKAFTITAGDKLGDWIGEGAKAFFSKRTVKEVKEVDADYLKFDYEEGGFGMFSRQHFVNKIIE